VEVIPEEEEIPEVEIIEELVEEPIVIPEEIKPEVVKPEEIPVPEIIIDIPKIIVKKELVPEELKEIIREVYTLCPRKIVEEKPLEIIPCKYDYPHVPVKRMEMHVPCPQKKLEEEQYEIACQCKPHPTTKSSNSKLIVKCPKYNNAFDNRICKVNGPEPKKSYADRNPPMEQYIYVPTQYMKNNFNKPRFRDVPHSRNKPLTCPNCYRNEQECICRKIDIPRQPYENCRCKCTVYNNHPRMNDRNYHR